MNNPACVVLLAAISTLAPLQAQTSQWSDLLIGKIRAAATMVRMVPGVPPQTLHVLRFAGSDVPQSSFLQGGSDERMSAVYSVYQIRFLDGWIMVDAEVDAEIAGNGVTVQQDKYNQVQQALRGASSIVVTHEHHDHVAAVIRTPDRELIAPKTLLTRAQVQTLVEHPNIPAI